MSREITPEEAKQILFNQPIRSWKEKEWKDKRNEILKDHCEQCGSSGILVVQHFWHPQEWKDIINSKFKKYHEMVALNPPMDITVLDKEVIKKFHEENVQEIREVCPQCDSVNLIKRINTKPSYKCNKKGCYYEFDIAIEKKLPELIDDRDIAGGVIQPTKLHKSFTKIRNKIMHQRRDEYIKNNYITDINREACLEYIEESLRYLSCEDTKTYCKKCATNYDINGLNLCPVCKNKNKKINNKTCIECKS